MNAGKIQEFLSALGCSKISVSSRWVRATCPFRHRHSGGKDEHPSFGIVIRDGDKSGYHCFGCGVSGDPINLLWRMSVEGLQINPELFWFLVHHNQIDVDKLEDVCDVQKKEVPLTLSTLEPSIKASRKYAPFRRKRKSRFVHPEDVPQAEVPEEILKRMIRDMPEDVLAYLTRRPNKVLGIEGRRLDRLTVSEWELGWAPLKQRICIPIRDETGKLVAISGRVFERGGKTSGGSKYIHSRFKRDRILYGEHFRDSDIRVGYLFEGFFDVMYAWHLGYKNVFARMGTYLSQLQAEKLVRWCDRLVLVPDGDVPGRDAVNRDAIRLRDLEVFGKNGESFKISEIEIVNMPEKQDADSLEPEQLRALLDICTVS